LDTSGFSSSPLDLALAKLVAMDITCDVHEISFYSKAAFNVGALHSSM